MLINKSKYFLHKKCFQVQVACKQTTSLGPPLLALLAFHHVPKGMPIGMLANYDACPDH